MGLPAGHGRRIHHHHGMGQLGVLRGQHQTQHAAQGVPHEHHRAGVHRHQGLGEGQQLFHQMRPVAADRVGWVVADFFQGVHLQTTSAQFVQHHAVGASRKTVAMKKKHQRCAAGDGSCKRWGHVSFFKA